MAYLALFVCFLGAAILLVFAGAKMPAAKLARILRYAGGGILSLATVFLGVTGRLSLAIPAGMAAYALFRGDLGRLGSLGMGRPSAGQTSDIETAWLSMWLDHDSGRMGGRVRQGRFAGADLEQLTQDDLMALRRDMLGDADSLRLLESYLERVRGMHADAQEDAAEHSDTPPPRRGGGMSREEAYEVLGLTPGASAEDIKHAHRELMQKVHPDRGGSSYLAAKLNQAKDLLLKAGKT